jgi:hypothetical protein
MKPDSLKLSFYLTPTWQIAMTSEFNPFTDRLSRDIRNELSVSLPKAIKIRSLEPVQIVADRFLADQLPDTHLQYIDSRLQNYADALNRLPQNTNDSMVIAAILWDLKLFFEVHEILEPEWIEAQGDKKLLLQALIRAAGVYINLELGYRDRAAKIGGKAIPILIRFQQELQKDLNAEKLIRALQELDPDPPQISLQKDKAA